MPSTKRSVARSLVVALALLAAVVVPGAPARAAWAPQIASTIQIYAYTSGGSPQMLGRAEGWVQLDDGGSLFRYSFTFCRQSSYQLPYMTISVNVSYSGGQRYATPIATVFAPYSGNSTAQPCYGATGTAANEHGYPNFFNVEFVLTGSTFIGSAHTLFTQDRLIYNPY